MSVCLYEINEQKINLCNGSSGSGCVHCSTQSPNVHTCVLCVCVIVYGMEWSVTCCSKSLLCNSKSYTIRNNNERREKVIFFFFYPSFSRSPSLSLFSLSIRLSCVCVFFFHFLKKKKIRSIFASFAPSLQYRFSK